MSVLFRRTVVSAMLACLAVSAHAETWSPIARISSTLGNVAGRICIGEGLMASDIGCPSTAPYVSTSSGFVGVGTGVPGAALHVENANFNSQILVTRGGGAGYYLTQSGNVGSIGAYGSTNQFSVFGSALSVLNTGVGIGTTSPNAKLDVIGSISASNVYVTGTTGTVSATYGYFRYISGTQVYGSFVGDGSGLTNLSLQGDRITSGTVSVTVNTNGYISLTTGVTDWGYLSSGNSYLPTLVAGRVSATNISGTLIQTGQSAATCSNSISGSIRYNTTSNTIQFCNGTGWTSLSSGTSAGVSALASLTDVTITNLAGRDYLRYDSDSGKWVNISESTVMSTTTMAPGFPDAIRCVGSDGATRIMYLEIAPNAGNLYSYRSRDSAFTTNYGLNFNSSGSFNSHSNLTGADCISKTVDELYASGAAFNFIGNANISSDALGDRITSGTHAVTVNTASGFVSLSENGTTWGYLSAGNSYLPTLVANKVSSTNVSATYLQLSSPTTVLSCNAGFTGAMRYTSGTTQVCDGSNWSNIGIGVPTGTIAAFSATSCPSGWSEYTASRGRFLRGIDNGAGNDPGGTRAPGNVQADLVGSHSHDVGISDAAGTGTGIGRANNNVNVTGANKALTSSGAETRPKNVAVIFCSYSGFQSAPGQTVLTTLASLTDVSIAGVTAGQALVFDGASWAASNTAPASNAEGDRITSGTHAVTVNTSSGYVSLSTGGTNWGYLSAGNSYLPTLVAGRVSSTNVSATYLQLSSPTTVLACNSGFTGAMRYTSGTMQVCDGSNWSNIGIGVPTGTIAAFSATSCPSGWSEYTASRGRFLRGYDNGAGIDPDGNRTPGTAQVDAFKAHKHNDSYRSNAAKYAGNGETHTWRATVTDVGSGGVGGTSTEGGAETRPKNVAVIFCSYSGFQSAPGQTILTTLASLTDVSIAGVTAGQALVFDGASWVASNTAPASNAEGDRITSGTHAVTVNTGSGYVSLSTGGAHWGYLSGGVSYLPTITASKVSSTNVSATYLQLNSPSTVLACNSGFTGAMRYTSGTMQVCDGSDWGNIGIGVPTGTIAAFAATSCPAGWTEYTESRGRFLRGIDNGAGNDPGGTRAPGNAQADAAPNITGSVGPFLRSTIDQSTGALSYTNAAIQTFGGSTSRNFGYVDFDASSSNAKYGAANEIRPKNVAVIFCSYSGFQSAPGQTVLTTLASLTDVSIAGVTAGQALVFDGASWVPSNTTGGGGSTPGDRITSGTHAVTLNENAGRVSLSTAGTTWGYFGSGGSFLPTLYANRIGISTTSPNARLDVVGTISASDAIQVGSSNLTCGAGLAGALRYNAGTLELCNGSSWTTFFTQSADPNAFGFTDQTGVAVSQTITSNAVTLAGFPGTLTATCNAGCTAIARNGVWGGAVVTGFSAGDSIAIRQSSSGSVGAGATATVTVGGRTSGVWTVTTADESPNPFSFTDVEGASTLVTYASEAVSLTGFTGTLTASCINCTAIARNGVWGVSPMPGFTAGNSIQIRQNAHAGLSESVTATVTLGTTTSSPWSVTTTGGCAPGVLVGQACPDGTILAGFSSDGSVPMYTTRCDLGQTWDGSACTGTRATRTWNKGTTDWTDTGFTSHVTGLANTQGLADLVDAGSPYNAAKYCSDLSAHGHDDWYLPARNELHVFYLNRVAIGGFDTDGTYYWSSSELNNGHAWHQRFSDGSQTNNVKDSARLVRCARR